MSFHPNDSETVSPKKLITKNFNSTFHTIHSGDLIFKKVLQNRSKNRPSNYNTITHSVNTNSNNKFITRVNSTFNMSPYYNNNICKKFMINNDSFINRNTTENNCSVNCHNLSLLKECEIKLKKLMESNGQLKHINEYLMSIISKKEDMYMRIQKENVGMKCSINATKTRSYVKKENNIEIFTNNNIKNKNINFNNRNSVEEIKSYNNKDIGNLIKSKKFKIIENLNEKSSLIKNIKNNTISGYFQSNLKSTRKQSNSSNNLNLRSPNKRSSRSPEKSTNYYERLYEMLGRSHRKKFKLDSRTSLLALNEAALMKMIHNDLMLELEEITYTDEKFIEAMRNLSEDKLVAFCDVISNSIKDYKSSLNIIKRVKHFLNVNVNLVTSVLVEDAAKKLIKNCCEILECERTSLFVYDKISDMLVVHSGEGLKKLEVKIPINSGLVGFSFQTGETVKVDDAYADSRFNRDVDKSTGFKTRNILCHPLRNNDGEIFGVIQSVNKNKLHFTNDDEELMEIFSKLASSILRNSMNFDENSKYTSRLKMLIEFSVKIETICDLPEFTLVAEDLLMSLFGSHAANFLYYNKLRGCLIHMTKFHIEEKKKVGIVNYVLTRKEFFGCLSVDDSEIYNNLTDLETGLSLITFPILNNQLEVMSVVQLTYSDKLVSEIKKPKELEMNVIDLFVRYCSIWLSKFNSKIIEDLITFYE